jgi:hypothetical protein
MSQFVGRGTPLDEYLQQIGVKNTSADSDEHPETEGAHDRRESWSVIS